MHMQEREFCDMVCRIIEETKERKRKGYIHWNQTEQNKTELYLYARFKTARKALS